MKPLPLCGTVMKFEGWEIWEGRAAYILPRLAISLNDGLRLPKFWCMVS